MTQIARSQRRALAGANDGEHGRACHAGKRREHEDCHRRDGQYKLTKSCEERLAVSSDRGIDQQEACDPLRRRRENIEAARRIGRKAEQIVEHIDKDEARDECRHTDAERTH